MPACILPARATFHDRFKVVRVPTENVLWGPEEWVGIHLNFTAREGFKQGRGFEGELWCTLKTIIPLTCVLLGACNNGLAAISKMCEKANLERFWLSKAANRANVRPLHVDEWSEACGVWWRVGFSSSAAEFGAQNILCATFHFRDPPLIHHHHHLTHTHMLRCFRQRNTYLLH